MARSLANVVLYRTASCPYCQAAARLLRGSGVVFEEIDVDARPDLRAWMREASAQATVPQIFINARAVGSFSDLAALEQEGRLAQLLAVAPASSDLALPR